MDKEAEDAALPDCYEVLQSSTPEGNNSMKHIKERCRNTWSRVLHHFMGSEETLTSQASNSILHKNTDQADQ